MHTSPICMQIVFAAEPQNPNFLGIQLKNSTKNQASVFFRSPMNVFRQPRGLLHCLCFSALIIIIAVFRSLSLPDRASQAVSAYRNTSIYRDCFVFRETLFQTTPREKPSGKLAFLSNSGSPLNASHCDLAGGERNQRRPRAAVPAPRAAAASAACSKRV